MVKKAQKHFYKTWVRGFANREIKLSGTERYIMDYLIDNMDIANKVTFGPLEQKVLAKDLNSTLESIQTLFRKILKYNPTFVVKVDTAYYTYMVAPDLAVKREDYDCVELLYQAYETEDKETINECLMRVYHKNKVVEEKVIKRGVWSGGYAENSIF